jgi:acetylornithine deacetylase/succinyl-diaminopimelate desuccinylase-like protein
MRLDGFAGTVEQGLNAYVKRYGDKSKEADPATGKPKVERHFAIEPTAEGYRLAIWGSSGHMASILDNDNACTKAAFLVEQIVDADPEAQFGFPGSTVPDPLLLEGGQGFLPTHSLEEVTRRMQRAARRAAEKHCRWLEVPWDPGTVTMTFEKLHNDAYACDPEHPAVGAFVDAVRGAGVEVEEPLRGWDVSCDARIFAREYPDAAVITFGAGRLEHAHSAQEQVRLDDVARAAQAVARFALTHDPSAKEERTGP